MFIPIRSLTANDLPQLHAHFDRHRAESGRGEHHFMPFAPDDPGGPRGLNAEALARACSERHWQRGFIALSEGQIVGEANLKGDGLRVGLHRCQLGIGIERPYRRQGLGRRLLAVAIEFARGVDGLSWIDLRVFGHNDAARALYRSAGFIEVATLADRFRIDGESIDDVIMSLSLTSFGTDL